ncbi:hypothetical protein D3C72_829340 [compost metagenome]
MQIAKKTDVSRAGPRQRIHHHRFEKGQAQRVGGEDHALPFRAPGDVQLTHSSPAPPSI